MSAAGKVFITGGASGLGLALARQYLADGWQVAIGDCDTAALAGVLQDGLPGVIGLTCDVTSEQHLLAARDTLLARWGTIDLVFNNAGVAVAGRLEDCALADWEWIVNINLLGVVRGCRIFAPVLRAQGHGRLVNIASMAGLIHPPAMAAYCATKAAVVALSEVLERELAGSGAGVSVVCPGFFRTGLSRTSRATSAPLQAVLTQLVADSPVPAERIARRIRRGVAKERFLILTHRPEAGLWWLKRLLPHGWFVRVMTALIDRAVARRTAAPLVPR